jgi:exonuclease SbcC
MRILRVELENIKSYRDQTVEFAAGTNAICGENGAGKSTLLEAIGSALFNHPPSRQSDFIRQGEESGCVTVHFVSGTDERVYQVVRRFGKASEYYVYDPELKGKIVNGRKDVLDWLKEHLGLEGTADPAVLFRDAIGVPQGLLTAAFLQSRAERKVTFDRLLQVDDFEKVYDSLRETRHYLRDRMAEVRARIAALEERVRRLPELERQVEALRDRISEAEKRLEAIRRQLETVTRRREALEALRQQLDALENRLRQLEIRIAEAQKQREMAQAELDRAEKAARIVEECRADYPAYLAAQQHLARLEDERRQRDALREGQRDLEHHVALKQDRVRQLEINLQEAEQAAAQMDALRPLVARQEELEGAIQRLREEMRELSLAHQQLQKLRDEMAQHWMRLKAVKEALAKGHQLEEALRMAEQALEQARADKSAVEQQQGILRAEAERLKKQIAALETAEAAICPVCEQPLSAAHRDDLLARNRAQIEALQRQSRALHRQIAELSERIRQHDERRAELQAQLHQLPDERARRDWAERLARLRAERADWRRRLAELEAVPESLRAWENELKALGDPRAEYQRLSGIAQQRETITRNIASTQGEIKDLQAKITELEAALRPYADLDARIEQLRTEMTKLEPHYRRFLENKDLAEQLPEWQTRVARIGQALQDLESQRSQVSEERTKLAAGFDPDALEEVRREEEGLQRDASRLAGELKVLREQLKHVEREVAETGRAQAELQDAQAARKRLEHTDQVIEFVRTVIHNAGPHLVRMVAGRVSAAATRIFREIMADPTSRLHWNEDYGIVLEVDGRERDFAQLSGGEQMAAALAVRLALLRELSKVDVAFFDEPTSNLDRTRRGNLAEQIVAIRNTGLSQLFVISHDDTFEEVTDHVVRVRKENGESVVETL